MALRKNILKTACGRKEGRMSVGGVVAKEVNCGWEKNRGDGKGWMGFEKFRKKTCSKSILTDLVLKKSAPRSVVTHLPARFCGENDDGQNGDVW